MLPSLSLDSRKGSALVKEVTLRKMGGSVGATLPREMVERLRLVAGDKVFAVETEKGVLLTPHDPALERGLEIYEEAARKYRNALHELAR